MRSDIQHRSDAVIDQLTGMLNRNALDNRVAELAQQSALTGESIGIIVGDLDHFKRVNDTLGHSTGDVVLREVAYQLRKQLRAFDLAYRLGGEEFLILLPGSDLAQSAELAEQLRAGIAGDSVAGGLNVTMSFGVGASRRGEHFDYATVFKSADAALYRAKRKGRDQVCLSESAGAPALSRAGLRLTRPAQAPTRASSSSSPASVWLVAESIRTCVSSPGAASPAKLTTLLWRVRPRRRSGSVRELPSTSTSSVRPTKRCARSRAPRWTASSRRSMRSTLTGCGTSPSRDLRRLRAAARREDERERRVVGDLLDDLERLARSPPRSPPGSRR